MNTNKTETRVFLCPSYDFVSLLPDLGKSMAKEPSLGYSKLEYESIIAKPKIGKV